MLRDRANLQSQLIPFKLLVKFFEKRVRKTENVPHLDADASRKRRAGADDDFARRKRRDLPKLDNYDRCCTFVNRQIIHFSCSVLVWDIWDKGRKPQKATLKHGSIHDYYDILEEIGR